LYTKHRLHLHNLGKEILSINLVLEIFILIEKKNSPITNIIELRYHETQPQTISPSVNQLIPLTSVANDENTLVKHIKKKAVLLDDLGVTTSGRVQPEDLENSAEVSNSQVHDVVHTPRRQKKPLKTRKVGVLW
jgi:hypothetical protein